MNKTFLAATISFKSVDFFNTTWVRVLGLTLLGFTLNLFPLKNRTSQSFMFTKPVTQNVPVKQVFWHNLAYGSHADKINNFQVVAIFQKSSDNRCSKKSRKISEYFLLKDRSSLVVSGDDFNKFKRDVRAEWLDLPSDFKGEFTLFPEQRQVGGYLDIKYDLKKILPDSFFEFCWVGATLSISSIKNELNLKEEINSGAGSIIKQLQRDNLEFGKFKPCSKTTGFSDFKLIIGTEYNVENGFQANVDAYFLFPLAKKQNGRQLFQAFRGYNGHLGYGNSVNLQFPLSEKCSDYLFALYFEAESLYLFENHQYRSVDLDCKPWSRFLLLNSIDGRTNIPAINVLTYKFKVKPYNLVDLSAGFRYIKGAFEIEAGYALWTHGREHIELEDRDCCITNLPYGIAAAPGQFTPEGLPATASLSDINKQGPTDKDKNENNIFVPIQLNDLNLKSGESQTTLVNRFHFALGGSNENFTYGTLYGLGFFYEIPQNNAALQQWGVWAKLGMNF